MENRQITERVSAICDITARKQAEAKILGGGGEMGALMRAYDWATSPLGPVSSWPQSLRTAVSICLNSRSAILLWWGPDLVMLYNDAYSAVIGDKHPDALGQRGRYCWPEIWSIIEPMLEGVLNTGQATWANDLQLLLRRHGYIEECYFTFSYSPIRDESGSVGGVFTPVFETTEKVIDERRLRTLRDLAACRVTVRDMDEVYHLAAETLATNPYDLPFALLYTLDDARTQARLTGAAGIAMDTTVSPLVVDLMQSSTLWPLAQAAQTGQAVLVDALPHRAAVLPTGAWPVPPQVAVVQPIIPRGATQPIAVLVAALSPRKAYDAAYRTFVEDVAEEITQILADACSHEAERQRTESYVALAQFRQEALSHEQALRREADVAKAQVVSILESMGDGFVSLDDDLRITRINTATERIFHLRREELLDRPYLDAVPQAHATHVEAALKRALTERTPVTFEAFYRLADIWVDVCVYSLPQGGLSMFIRDITGRKHLEKAIQKSEERFRVALKGSPITVFQHDHQLRYIWLYNSTPGFPASDVTMIGKTDAEYLPPDEAANLMALKHQVLDTGVGLRQEVSIQTDGGVTTFDMAIEPLQNKSGVIVGLTCAAIDITSRKQAQVEREQLLSNLQRVNEELRQFAYIVSHDLSEPLRTMSNFAKLLAKHYQGALDATADEYIAFITDSAKRMQSMLTDLLTYTRTDRKQFTFAPVDCEALLSAVLMNLRAAIEDAKAEITHDPLPTVSGDPTCLGQVLQNLIGNALKFRGTAPPRIHISAHRAANHWRFVVRDNGIGIDPRQADRIFQVFQRLYTRTKYPGTGMGLAICKKIVEGHEGQIWVDSRPGEGASFSFTIRERHNHL